MRGTHCFASAGAALRASTAPTSEPTTCR
jgi:hypothetical protein